jgi:hypothetical protein
MNGHDDQSAMVYSRANDNAARVIAYLSPFLFWGTVGVITTGIFLLG